MAKQPLNPVLSEEVGAKLFTCMVCGKNVTQVYGRWNEVGGTCSKKCETVQEQKPRDFGEPTK